MPRSQHPIIRELNRTGASSRLPGELIDGLFNGLDSRLSASAPKDMDSLRTLCIEIYRPQLGLELSVSDPRITQGDFCPGLVARNGLHQLLRESVLRKEQGGYWWVPHNLLARQSVSRAEIPGFPCSTNVRKLMADVLTEGHSWGEEASRASEKPVVDLSPARHVFAISSLYSRKLYGLLNIEPRLYSEGLAKLRPGDLFSAWSSARRLR